MFLTFVSCHNCKQQSDYNSPDKDHDIDYDEDHFGDFIEFKKELKTNLSFLAEVSICACASKALNFDIELILKALICLKNAEIVF